MSDVVNCGIEGFIVLCYIVEVDGSIFGVEVIYFVLSGYFDEVVIGVIINWCYEFVMIDGVVV